MIVAGIDPGKNGAIVILRDRDIVSKALLKDVTPRVFLKQHQVQTIFIEKAQVMAKDPGVRPSATAMFTYGREYGYLCGTLVDQPWQIYYIPPNEWTGTLHKLSPLTHQNPKESSLWVAKHLWPHIDWRASERSRIAHDGIVDAALIGLYGYRRYVCNEK